MTLPLNHTEDFVRVYIAQLRASRSAPGLPAGAQSHIHMSPPPVSPYLRLVPRDYAQALRDTQRVEHVTRRFEGHAS